MANNNDTTTKFKVDISELKKAMQDAKRAVAVANSEFKAVSSSMDDWTKSSDGLSAKLKQLDTTMSSQKTVLKSLEAQYEALTDEEKAGSKAADDLRIKINNQKAAINKTQKEIDKFEAALEDVTAEEKNAAKGGKDVAESLDDMGDSAKDAEDGFTILKGAVATFAGNVMTSLVGSIKDGISSLAGLADGTREYRTELAKLETGAAQAGASTDYIKGKWQDLGAVLGDEGAVSEGLNNLLAAGFTTEKEMDAITKSLEGAAIKWKDTLKFEGLSDGLQETLATGAAVGSFGELLERSGVNLDNFNAGLAECSTEAEKQNYVLEQLSGLGLAEVSEAYRAQNKDIIAANKANAKYTDTVAKMGKKIEPVTTTVKEGFTGLLEEALKLVGGVDMEAFSSKIEEGFEVIKNDVLPAIKDGLGWILDNKDAIVAALAAIAAGFAAFKIAGMITSAVTAVKNLTTGVGLLKGVMAALGGPVTIIITAVSALTAGFIYLWNNCEGFRNFFINMWETIKNAVAIAVEAVVGFFTSMWENITAGVTAFIDGVTSVFTTVVEWFNTNVIEPLASFFTGLWNTISSGAQALWNTVSGIFAPVVEWFSKLFMSIYNTLSDIVTNIVAIVRGLWITITTIFSVVGQWFYDKVIKPVADFFKKLWDGISDGAKKLWSGIKSVFSAVAKWFSNTVIEPVEKVFTGLWDGLKNGASKAWEGIKSVFSTVASFFKNIFTKAWTAVKNVFSVGGRIFDGIKDGIVTAFKTIVNAIIKGINKVVSIPFDGINWALNKIRSINILGVEPFTWIKTISTPQIPLLAKGGVVDKATAAIFGEDGREAVLPLERNTGWMRKLAADLVAEMQLGGVTGSSSVTGVSGVSGVTYNFYQTNNSPKALSRLEIYRQSKNLLGFVGGA